MRRMLYASFGALVVVVTSVFAAGVTYNADTRTVIADYAADPEAPFVVKRGDNTYYKLTVTSLQDFLELDEAGVDALIVEAKAKQQNLKPEEQRTYENKFFELTEAILTAVADPRAGQTPPVKLGFDEIQTIIETIQAADPMAAVNFSLKLLTIDAALKRHDTLWWDNAMTHVIEE